MRITHITAGLITFVLMMVMTQAAAAQASAAPQTPPPPSAQAGPQDRPSTAPPSDQSSPSQTSPSQTSPGQSQAAPSGQANSPSQSSQSSDNDNPLNLTEDQKTKLRPIIADENQKMEAVRNDSSLNTDQKIQKANQIREDASPKIRAILTQEQLQKLAELQQKARQERDQNQGQSPSSNPQH